MKLRSDEFIIGCALNTFALGLTGFLSRSIFGASGTKGNPFLPSLRLPGIESIPFLGKILSGNSLFVYLTLLFVLLLWRGITIAAHAPDRFGALLVVGFTVQVALQAVLNVAVVTNTIPNTGISLPFFSSGGTSLMMLLGEMGIVLSVSRGET